MKNPLLLLKTRRQTRLRILHLESSLFAIEAKWRAKAITAKRLGREQDVLVRVIKRIGPVMVQGAVAHDDTARALLARLEVEVPE